MPYENNNDYARALYARQEAAGAFAPCAAGGKKPYVVMLPLPNVTGSLHIGHAFTFTAQDIEIRYHRMMGEPALWLPGTDHASIAVQMLVKRQIEAEGGDIRAMGREGFLKRAWEWVGKYRDNIVGQLRALGFSLDWSRERFTMSPEYSHSVLAAFVRLYEDGLVYRDARLVNWDPVMLTVLSDLEVVNREEPGTFWHIRYRIKDSDEYITIATTRPETMLGDAAIAVAGDDERYARLVGESAVIPLVGREIPIIVDEHADKTKGTGAVKITPAHDFDDYDVGRRHGLPMINIFSEDARILKLGDGNAFTDSLVGLDRFDARERVVEALGDAVAKTETITHAVPHAERGDAILEPRLTAQWYCDVSKLAARAVKRARSGELRFFPDVWRNTWYSWLENIQPWCVSRQLWWGHRIPAYYGDKGGLAYVGFDPPPGLKQDEDTLDTWFSSALWPMATLGWPNEGAEDFKRFFPGTALITGFDIIFFWVARMVMFAEHFTGRLPFENVVMRGLVADENGVKMSKTKGNVIDPLVLVGEYGIDAVRFAICFCSNQNRVLPFGRSDVENARRFLTKLLNAVAFWEAKGVKEAKDGYAAGSPLADWILSRMNAAIAAAHRAMAGYRYDEYAGSIYHFVWDDFCDKFIEMAKKDSSPSVTAAAKIALKSILLVLQPVVPFVSAEVWERLGFGPAEELISHPFAMPMEVRDEAAAMEWMAGLDGRSEE
ncbi:MAG: valine--tRNA ligase, partial [Rickettsiales bacterium]|nr:valine--tRNA ligase [Rickettsiales bacterium]